jgi:hypothetical protein
MHTPLCFEALRPTKRRLVAPNDSSCQNDGGIHATVLALIALFVNSEFSKTLP